MIRINTSNEMIIAEGTVEVDIQQDTHMHIDENKGEGVEIIIGSLRLVMKKEQADKLRTHFRNLD